ncbi:hypothetical protein B0H15DRAFT_798954 [Mycena belliarum]|uniref:Uncharacterized protein n=1 Tax=Mycena belliarum TaxID=1033014 RepID=A0AAD6U7H1_9AGAR|nr:hypothetical protein B0H15DRAFT_798954 [Mycena belliae]
MPLLDALTPRHCARLSPTSPVRHRHPRHFPLGTIRRPGPSVRALLLDFNHHHMFARGQFKDASQSLFNGLKLYSHTSLNPSSQPCIGLGRQYNPWLLPPFLRHEPYHPFNRANGRYCDPYEPFNQMNNWVTLEVRFRCQERSPSPQCAHEQTAGSKEAVTMPAHTKDTKNTEPMLETPLLCPRTPRRHTETMREIRGT